MENFDLDFGDIDDSGGVDSLLNSLESFVAQIEAGTNSLRAQPRRQLQTLIGEVAALQARISAEERRIFSRIIDEMGLSYDNDAGPYIPTVDEIEQKSIQLKAEIDTIKSEIRAGLPRRESAAVEFEQLKSNFRATKTEIAKNSEMLAAARKRYQTLASRIFPKLINGTDPCLLIVKENGYLDQIITDKENVTGLSTDHDREAFWNMLNRKLLKSNAENAAANV